MSAVEKAIREADQSAWTTRNPEIEARATGAAAQLHAAIADLEQQLADAKAAKDTRKVKELTESLAARKAWLKQIEAVAK
jgi:pantothenate synthetase